MFDLKLYSVSDKYIEYLRNTVDIHVFANTDDYYVHTRKYVGIVLEIGSYKYYVPMSSPKKTDYMYDRSGHKAVRKSIIPIIRMIDRSDDGSVELMGTLNLSNMIPVPEAELQLYDLDNEPDHAYKDLVQKEVRFINRHTKEILKNANVIYNQKQNGSTEIGYLKSTLDFKALEKALDRFINCDISDDE